MGPGMPRLTLFIEFLGLGRERTSASCSVMRRRPWDHIIWPSITPVLTPKRVPRGSVAPFHPFRPLSRPRRLRGGLDLLVHFWGRPVHDRRPVDRPRDQR